MKKSRSKGKVRVKVKPKGMRRGGWFGGGGGRPSVVAYGGRRYRNLRVELGLTQGLLSRLFRMSSTSVHLREADRRPVMWVEVVALMALRRLQAMDAGEYEDFLEEVFEESDGVRHRDTEDVEEVERLEAGGTADGRE